ncbi:copper homeostasis protein CutC, partial [Fulvivirga lutimaris]|uniref:copper homeostasis protein CutC n=1 Tax=Fulvivirga lutimaris TaxID=1819566 RepID=UPI0012BCB7B1
MSYQIEICANSVQSVINAEKAGAQRVELCDNLWEGGTTPSAAMIKLAKEKTNIAIYVLVRPRGGDFVYSDLEFEIIKEDIRICKELGVEGIVSGVLNADGTVDKERTRELVELSKPLPFTFHRAFDVANDAFRALEDIIDCGAVRILSSGQKNSAIEGIDLLKQIQEKAAGRISIMPGGGINPDNISELLSIGCTEFHMSGKKGQESLAKPSAV